MKICEEVCLFNRKNIINILQMLSNIFGQTLYVNYMSILK